MKAPLYEQAAAGRPVPRYDALDEAVSSYPKPPSKKLLMRAGPGGRFPVEEWCAGPRPTEEGRECLVHHWRSCTRLTHQWRGVRV